MDTVESSQSVARSTSLKRKDKLDTRLIIELQSKKYRLKTTVS